MNFKLLARGMEVGALTAALKERPQMWTEDTRRQSYPGSAHKDTQAIWLRAPACEAQVSVFDCLEVDACAENIERLDCAGVIDAVCRRIDAHLVGRILLAKLLRGGRITPHIDEGAYARFFARFHLVIESAAEVIFRCGREEQSFAPGDLFWFDHQLEHEVWNPSGADRTHLIVDAVAPGFCGALHG